MKRLIHFLLPIVILLGACGKEQSLEPGNNNPGTGGPGTGGPIGGGSSNSGYFMRCKLDGTSKNLSALVFASKMNVAGAMVSHSIIGKLNTSPSNLEGLNISINTQANINLTAGTYSVDNPTIDYVVGAVYNPNSQSIVYGTTGGDPGNNPFKVVITSISATEIAGTFSGTLFKIDVTNPGATPTPHAITDGEFKAKFQ